ncbi:hypothetical protein E4T43_02896 [Aureobasidium subglaciale]|nr:hypothetical protein E4T43_02896 [Aureobasidium subglaciale]
MGPAISVPRPTTICDASTAFSIQYSGSGNSTWDSKWVGLADSNYGQVGGILQPVAKANAATFFRDPNGYLYSADLATMNYTAAEYIAPDSCLLFAPSDSTLPWFYNLRAMTISPQNTLKLTNNGPDSDPNSKGVADFLIENPLHCITTYHYNFGDYNYDPGKYTNIILNVVKTGTCPGQICKPLPAGSGPVPSPDNPTNFLALQDFSDAANGAVTPTGYQNVFSNLKAANNANGYLGYTTMSSYDVAGCSKRCNAIVGCQAFNIYYERDPKVEPGSGDYCSNPPSTTSIKCSFWGGPVTKENAVNAGQWRKDFQIVIAGSNGYVNNAIAPIANYKAASFYGNSIMVAPTADCSSSNPTVAWQFYNDGAPFSASRCAAACDAYSSDAKRNATLAGTTNPVLCNSFNTFILNKGSKSLGQMCNMYSQAFKSSRATAKSQLTALGEVVTFSSSYGFARSDSVGSCGANY